MVKPSTSTATIRKMGSSGDDGGFLVGASITAGVAFTCLILALRSFGVHN